MPADTTTTAKPNGLLARKSPAASRDFWFFSLAVSTLSKELLCLEGKRLLGRARGQADDFIFRQLCGIFITAILEIPAHEEIVLHRLHVLLEIGDPRLRLGDNVSRIPAIVWFEAG
jgi:hypothetical protein